MHDIVHNDGGDSRSHYTLQWLDLYASEPTASDRYHRGGENFADRLYQCCLHALQDFYRQERDQCSSSSHLIVLRECLGKFYLWGEPFGTYLSELFFPFSGPDPESLDILGESNPSFLF